MSSHRNDSDRIEQQKQAAYNAKPTTKEFRVPRTLASDFEKFLSGHIPGAVMPFQVIHDWYDQFFQGYKKEFWNGQIYVQSSKSRYTNEDNHLEIRFARYANVHKGDYVVDQGGTLYLLDWEIPPESNNKPSRCMRCNMKTTFSTFVTQTVSWDGILIQPQHWQPVAIDIPCNAYRYEGRPEYSAVSGTPGISQNALTVMTMQYNMYTKNIDINDKFMWGNQQYIVIDVNLNGLNMDGTSGILTVQARMKPGGDLTGSEHAIGSVQY